MWFIVLKFQYPRVKVSSQMKKKTRWHTLPRTHAPTTFSETKSWKWEEGEKVSLKTHAAARGMGKNVSKQQECHRLYLEF